MQNTLNFGISVDIVQFVDKNVVHIHVSALQAIVVRVAGHQFEDVTKIRRVFWGR